VVAVNEASLDIFGAESEGQLIAALPRIFGREAFAMFRAEVREWRDGRSRLETEASVRTLAGATKSISLRLSVIPGHERDWTRVVVSIFDLTAHKEAEAFARTALHEKEVLLKEVHHRVKNNLQVISSLLSLQAHRHDDPRLRAAFADSKARVQSIALVHERLYRARDLSRVNLDEYLHTLVEGLAMAHDAERRGIHARVEASRTRVPVDIAIPAGLVVNELVMNSLKYAFPDGRSGAISVTVRPPSPGMVELTVSDDGVGLPPDVDPRHSKTLGLDLVFTFAQQLGAEIEVSRDGGTRFTLVFSATDR
jgi:two-component sensor histidine kinase